MLLLRFLYVGTDPEGLAEMLGAWGDSVLRTEPRRFVVDDGDETLCFWAETDRSAAIDALRDEYFNAVIVDLRSRNGRDGAVEAGFDLLRALDAGEDIETRYGFHRILALVGNGPDDADHILALGRSGIGAVHCQSEGVTEADFGKVVVARAIDLVRRREIGKAALCASGGGITGIYFELGALKCLDDCLGGHTHRFDLYFGISAGAVVMSLVANGYSVDEVMAAVAGVPGGRVPPLSLRLLRFSHLHYADIGRRLLIGARAAARDAKDALRGQLDCSFDALLLEYGDLVGAPFHSRRFEEQLRNVLEAPGATNAFGELERPLFVGASDQDARRHVLFGTGELSEVPISKAVQASLSVHPAFSSVRIGERYYEDGAVTRTSDFVEAIERGARLLFILDPFVPYVSRVPGETSRRGILYNIDQDLRTISFTRFENTRNWVLRKHPEVSSYTFLPSNRLRRLLGTNPMDHRPYLEIWRGAYLSTFNRIMHLRHRLRGDLAARGLTLDVERARAVTERLSATEEPSFDDFYPDGVADIRTPPLARQRVGRLGTGDVTRQRLRAARP